MSASSSEAINSTSEYDTFRFFEYNRDIDRRHVDRLKDSLQTVNDLHLYPIHVDTDMHIINGQHRFIAAKELGLPIYYVVDANFSPEKLELLNATAKRWSLQDALKFMANTGSEPAAFLMDLSRTYGLQLNRLMHVLGIKKRSIESTRVLEFYLRDRDGVIDGLNYVAQCSDALGDGFQLFNSTCRAFYLFARCPEFERQHFLKKLESSSCKIEKMQLRTVGESIRLFTDLYNFGKHQRRMAYHVKSQEFIFTFV